MESRKIPNDRLKISKFKLDSLLDITLSINANLPTDTLLSKYESILRESLGIGKVLNRAKLCVDRARIFSGERSRRTDQSGVDGNSCWYGGWRLDVRGDL